MCVHLCRYVSLCAHVCVWYRVWYKRKVLPFLCKTMLWIGSGLPEMIIEHHRLGLPAWVKWAETAHCEPSVDAGACCLVQRTDRARWRGQLAQPTGLGAHARSLDHRPQKDGSRLGVGEQAAHTHDVNQKPDKEGPSKCRATLTGFLLLFSPRKYRWQTDRKSVV